MNKTWHGKRFHAALRLLDTREGPLGLGVRLFFWNPRHQMWCVNIDFLTPIFDFQFGIHGVYSPEKAGKLIDLLPCPFCGDEPVVADSGITAPQITCPRPQGNRSGECPGTPFVEAATVEEATALWNKRA